MRIRRLLKGTGVCKAAEFENKVYNDELKLLSIVFYRLFLFDVALISLGFSLCCWPKGR